MTFKNYKVTLSLNGSVAMRQKKAAFDSILAMLFFNKQKNEGVFNGDYAQNLTFLDSTDGVYHTSFAIFQNVHYYDKEVLIKKFDHDFYAKFGKIVSEKGVQRGFVNTTTGHYKNGFFSIERVGVEKIIFYFRGDGSIVKELLSRFRFIGKKASLGWGEIENIELQEIEKDCSLVMDGRAMRNLPVVNNSGWDSSIVDDKVGLMRLTHPYWKKTDMRECWMP